MSGHVFLSVLFDFCICISAFLCSHKNYKSSLCRGLSCAFNPSQFPCSPLSSLLSAASSLQRPHTYSGFQARQASPGLSLMSVVTFRSTNLIVKRNTQPWFPLWFLEIIALCSCVPEWPPTAEECTARLLAKKKKKKYSRLDQKDMEAAEKELISPREGRNVLC